MIKNDSNLFVLPIDDIVIYAKSLEGHKQKFNQLFQRLRKADLNLQLDKCEFFKKELLYL